MKAKHRGVPYSVGSYKGDKGPIFRLRIKAIGVDKTFVAEQFAADFARLAIDTSFMGESNEGLDVDELIEKAIKELGG